MAEIVFILEPDRGRVTIEWSQADAEIAKEISKDLGQGRIVNCGRPQIKNQAEISDQISTSMRTKATQPEQIYLYRLYHYSTVDGPGRRSVIQLAGCTIRCPGCYVPETHERDNGRLTRINEIVSQIEKRQDEHDGVTILGGEPFDQTEGLRILVKELKARDFHLTLYTGFTVESLLMRDYESVNYILAAADLVIDGAFDQTMTRNAGEYRGSSNQRLIFYPVSRLKK